MTKITIPKALTKMENILYTRIKNKKELEKFLSELFNQKIITHNKIRYDDLDFNLVFTIKIANELLDIDLYYILDNNKNLFITEFGYQIN